MSEDQTSSLIVPPQQARSRKSLQKIIAAAEVVLRRDGLDGFSIANIAAASGISVGGLYARVKGKAELLQALKDEATGRLEASAMRKFGMGRLESSTAVAEALVDASVFNLARDEDLHRMLFRSGEADPELSRRGDEGRHRIFELYRTAFLDARRRPPDEIAEVAITMSYEFVVATVLARVRGTPLRQTVPWDLYAQHLKLAVRSYLRTLEGVSEA